MIPANYFNEQATIFKDDTAKILANYANHPAAILALDAQSKVFAAYIDAILLINSTEHKQLRRAILDFVDFVAPVMADPNALLELVLAKGTPSEIRQWLTDYEAADTTGEISGAFTNLSEQIQLLAEHLQ